MAVELGNIPLEHLTHVFVKQEARIIYHSVPGMEGDLAQTMGRPSVRVFLRGIFYGEKAEINLKQLRNAHLEYAPIDFFTEAVGEGFFTEVLISKLEVTQRAGYLDQFDYSCEVIEYVEPPEPVAVDSFTSLDKELLDEATEFMDDVQNALEEVSQLVDLITSFPNFGDPTTGLKNMPVEYTKSVTEGIELITNISDLF